MKAITENQALLVKKSIELLHEAVGHLCEYCYMTKPNIVLYDNSEHLDKCLAALKKIDDEVFNGPAPV